MRTRSVAALGLAAVFAIGCSDGLTTEPVETDVANVSSVALSSHANNGAVRWIPDEECGVFDGLGNVVFPLNCRNAIGTPSQNGNAMVLVRASGVYNPTGKTVRWDAYNPPAGLWQFYPDISAPPLPCGMFNVEGDLVFTVNWSASITPSGEAKFICHYKEEWEFTFPD